MRKFFPAALVGVFLLPVAANAQANTPPTVLLRIGSFDKVISTVKTIAKAVDKAEVGNQLEQLIKAQAGPKGLAGIDTKRPIGLYAHASGNFAETSAILMIPISDQKAFLGLLENVNYPAKKNKEGVYEVDQTDVPVPIGFRFAHKYAYITGMNLEALAPKSLIPPKSVFARKTNAVLSGTLRLDQIPEAFKDIFVAKMEEALEREKEKRNPNEDEAGRKLRRASIDDVGQQLANFVYGATDVSFDLDVNAKTSRLVAKLHVGGKKGTEFQKSLMTLAKGQSLFAGFVNSDADLAGSMRVQLTKKIKAAADQAIDKAIAKILEDEPNEKKRAQAKAVLSALTPTFKAGELDMGVRVQFYEGGKASFVSGIKVRNGKKVEATLNKLLKSAPPRDRAKIKLNVAKAGGANIHRMDLGDVFDDKARKLLGKNPVFVAVSNNAILVAAGPNGLANIKKAATAKGKSPSVINFRMNVADLTRFSEKELEQKIAKKVFRKGDKGTVLFSVRGGRSLNMRFEVGLSVLQYFAAVEQAKQEIRFVPPQIRFSVKAEIR